MAKAMTFTDAAYQLLKESGEPRHYRWLTEEALKRGLIVTEGKAPPDTMYASIFMEIKNDIPGKQSSRFVKTGRGMFGLAEWQAETERTAPKKPEVERRYFVFIVNEGQGVQTSNGRRQIFTFDVSGHERPLIANESECLGGVWRN